MEEHPIWDIPNYVLEKRAHEQKMRQMHEEELAIQRLKAKQRALRRREREGRVNVKLFTSASLAQLVARWAVNPKVVSSNLTRGGH